MVQVPMLVLLVALLCFPSQGFAPGKLHNPRQASAIWMGLDVVTYLRTEWVSAALVTNQTPKAADVCLELGTEDGRAVNLVPKTIRKLITSTASADGILRVSVQRQLKQQRERRPGAAEVICVDQRADDLKETANESVDVVISLQAAAKMDENGLDWEKSIAEAARVLKKGGRFIFVEQTTIAGVSYLQALASVADGEESDEERYPIFELVGYDDVDMVLSPHVAGVVLKSEDAGLTEKDIIKKEMRAEKDRLAELSITAYGRGLKKRKKKKKKSSIEET